ncbi:hypothetical protein E2F48_13815 [Arthrobacter crusticola]|uniref:Uncharacterized protein n=1 Tax=Arthrobacter crusticola TaxID=2547960 RepID=A0A4R5TUV7_9MICC|nr:hypothetical protein [Arthrobacter crusticola]TDK24864.1 hypothetical protein E2F48_13815 [Arthrobacter crusticola]
MTASANDDAGEKDKSGLAQAADSFTQNLADQVPDGIDSGPQDTANEGEDPRTHTHASLSEGSNARDNDGR